MIKKVFIVLLFSILVSACSNLNHDWGPIHITHVDGESPKLKIDTGIDNCSFKGKIRARDSVITLHCGIKF